MNNYKIYDKTERKKKRKKKKRMREI